MKSVVSPCSAVAMKHSFRVEGCFVISRSEGYGDASASPIRNGARHSTRTPKLSEARKPAPEAEASSRGPDRDPHARRPQDLFSQPRSTAFKHPLAASLSP